MEDSTSRPIKEILALLYQCNPPGYVVEPAPRACDYPWVWDSCDDEYDGYGGGDDEDHARSEAWKHYYKVEAERASGDR